MASLSKTGRLALGMLTMAGGSMASESSSKAAPASSAAKRPAVVLVHGIFDSAKAMRTMDRRLQSLGYETHAITFSPGNGKASISALAGQLDEFVRAHVPPGTPFHLVGHSMGGLVMRCYAQRFASAESISAFVTLGSPHQGSLWAWLFRREGCLDMRAGSPLLQDLAENDTKLARFQPLSIWTPMDLMILPSRSSMWPVARNEVMWLPLHPDLKHSRRVCTRVAAFLIEREKALVSHRGPSAHAPQSEASQGAKA